MLIRLKKRGYVIEHPDEADKRAKRLKLTAKGEEVVRKAVVLVQKVAHMLVDDLSDEEMQLCIQLLKPIDTRFTGTYQRQKNKPFEEIYMENLKR
jgi:DNA-binding MarR family transcriptional regulator